MKRGKMRSLLLLAGIVSGIAAAPVAAQEAPPDRPAAQALSPGVEVRLRSQNGDRPAGSDVDESALRYFAGRGDKTRVDAEIERLRALHPGWEPPDDLFGPVTRIDERPLWALYESDDFAAVREEIRRIGREHPDWSPPPRLIALMEEREVRERLVRLEEEGDWRRLLEVAASFPAQVACSRIDNMWRVTRAHAQLGDGDAATEVHARVIGDCPSLEHRIATLQKAREQVGKDRLDALFALEADNAKSPDESRRVAAVRKELIAPAGPPRAIQALFRKNATVADARRAEATVLRARHPAGAERLGWLHRDAGEHEVALAWFRRAHDWRPGEKPAEGLVLSLAALGRHDEIEVWSRRYPAALGVYAQSARQQRILAAFDAGSYATVLGLTESARSASDRTMRGWTYLQLERPTEATLAFESVVYDDAVRPSDQRDAAFGLARASLALGNLDDAEAITRTYRLPLEERYEIHAEVLARRADRAFAQQDYRTSVALLEARRSYAQPTRDLLIQEAWGRYHLGQSGRSEREVGADFPEPEPGLCDRADRGGASGRIAQDQRLLRPDGPRGSGGPPPAFDDYLGGACRGHRPCYRRRHGQRLALGTRRGPAALRPGSSAAHSSGDRSRDGRLRRR